jgi:hypothetical protein
MLSHHNTAKRIKSVADRPDLHTRLTPTGSNDAEQEAESKCDPDCHQGISPDCRLGINQGVNGHVLGAVELLPSST